MHAATPAPPTARAPVCAIVVTYHPDRDIADRLERILAQVDATFVVDNGSSDAELRMLRDAAAGRAVTLLCNHENLGVATALNVGVRRALADGFTWALLLDQDTDADPDIERDRKSVV